jgi:hypothetical protein
MLSQMLKIDFGGFEKNAAACYYLDLYTRQEALQKDVLWHIFVRLIQNVGLYTEEEQLI